ncbi:hypothetical protein ACHQM5_027233 [Ranunculus cassubicifolius]
MVAGSESRIPFLSTINDSNFDRATEVKAFDNTKTGVKGLVDSGISKVPRIFITPSPELNQKAVSDQTTLILPIIDLQGEHQEVVDAIKHASENWGFFQVVNHRVPLDVLDGMLKGVHQFHEEDEEVKKQYYSRDESRKVRFNSNFDIYQSKSANWRDSLLVYMSPSKELNPNELPATCRETTVEYTKQVAILGDTLFGLLSEALGLETNHLKQMNCAETHTLVSHYYPVCPEPDLTLGITGHTDASCLTIILQDHVGGLQILHQNLWVDARPIPGALVVNIGDLLQIMSNDKLKSIEHRVVANLVEPRASVAFFFTPRFDVEAQLYGPIKELIAEGSNPIYREFTNKEYVDHFFREGLDGRVGLDEFKL